MWLCEVKPCEFSKGAAPYRDSLTTDDLHFIIIYYLFLYFPLMALLLRLSMNLSFRRLDCIYAAVNSGIKRRRGLRVSLLNHQAASFGRSNCAEPGHWVLFYGLAWKAKAYTTVG